MTGLPFAQCDFKAEDGPRCREEAQATVISSARGTPDGVNMPTWFMPTVSAKPSQTPDPDARA